MKRNEMHMREKEEEKEEEEEEEMVRWIVGQKERNGVFIKMERK